MTAEEKLKRRCKKLSEWQSDSYVARDNMGRVHISCQDIDLIANLIIERLKEEGNAS